MKRKSICVILSIVMMFSLLVPCFAAGNTCNCGNAPVVSVVGFGHVPLVNGEGTQVFAPETEAILNAVLPCIPVLVQFLADDNMDALLDAVIPAAQQIFDPIKCDENGDSVDSTVKVAHYTEENAESYDYYIREDGQDQLSMAIADEIGGDHTFIFSYDWRRSPMDVADDLNAFIQSVKATTGHSKVSIDGQSMGTCMVQAYLAKYGKGDIQNIAMLSGAFTGLEMVTELFCGNLEVDADGLVDIIVQLINGNPDDDLGKLLKYTELFDKVLEKVAPLLQAGEYRDRLYKELFIPYFGLYAGMWSFVDASRYDEALNYMFYNSAFDSDGVSPTIASSTFIDKINLYHNDVQGTMKDRCTEYYNDANRNFFIVSNYNKQIAPVTPASKWNSDQVIETVHTSAYATVALRGETLGEDYVQAIDDGHNHISPDNVIDASTCWLPECTWFIKNMEHVKFTQYGNGPFYAWLLTSKNQCTIESDCLYPQFLYYNADADYLAAYLYQYGDVDMDGDIDLIDARLALRHSLERDTLEKVNLQRADCIDIDGVISTREVQSIADTYAYSLTEAE